MEIGNLIFAFIIIIFILWCTIVIINIIFKIFILNHLHKKRKLNSNISKQIIWLIKNGFLFYAFRKDYYDNYRSMYKYYEIKSPQYRRLVNRSAKSLRFGLSIFNIIFIMTLSINLFFYFSIILRGLD